MPGANIFGELHRAQLERLAADPSAGVSSRVIWNTTENRAKYDNGSAYRALLANDEYLTIGNHSTSSNNVRLHRAVGAVLQLQTGDQTTAEGTLGASLAQLSTRVENYATGSLPSAGQTGRIAYDTTLARPVFDNGSAWVTLSRNNSLFPGVDNLGVTYSAGVFTICAADGTALSATNPAYVVLQSKANPGRLVRYTVTANQNFQDDAHASSEIIGNLFGATTSIAWGNDLPFFIYAVGDDNETAIAFMLSRDPRASTSPASGSIGTPSSAVADAETAFFSFDNITTTSYDANPCLCIGAIRMQMSTSDDWTVQTLTNKDGIGKFHEGTEFTFPQNQNGAASGSHLLANGGTVPQFTTEDYKFFVRRNGAIAFFIYYSGDAGTDSGDAVEARFALPYSYRGSVVVETPGGSVLSQSAGMTNGLTVFLRLSNSTPTYGIPVGLNTLAFTLSNFPNGARVIKLAGEYPAFT